MKYTCYRYQILYILCHSHAQPGCAHTCPRVAVVPSVQFIVWREIILHHSSLLSCSRAGQHIIC